jgi:hypothetical protein
VGQSTPKITLLALCLGAGACEKAFALNIATPSVGYSRSGRKRTSTL